MSGMNSNEYVMDCGCRFKVIGDPYYKGGPPRLDFDPFNPPWNCPRVWALFASGRTKGIFQLEKSLGQNWSKMMSPESIEHVSALMALLRPGCLKAKDENGISMTKHYVLRKNGEEEIIAFDAVIADIMASTYSVLVYQEQTLHLAKKVAGFSLSEADELRKAMGKKDAEKMAKVKKMFLEKGREVKLLPDDKLDKLFDWIEKSNRYSFNKSHSVSYGKTAYITAYIKAHFLPEFYKNWLIHSDDKAKAFEEINDLIEDAKLFDIDVRPPDILCPKPQFFIVDKKTLQYGIVNLKGIGEKSINKIVNFSSSIDKDWGLGRFIIEASKSLTKTMLINFAESGALRNLFDVDRSEIVRQIKLLDGLTDTEYKKLVQSVKKNDDRGDIFSIVTKYAHLNKEEDGILHKQDRIKEVNELFGKTNPSKDTIPYIVEREKHLLGIAITAHAIDEVPAERVNCSCKDWLKTKRKDAVINVEVIGVDSNIIKKEGPTKGKKMVTLTVSDGTAKMTCKAFSKETEIYDHLFREDKLLILSGNRLQDDTFSIKRAWDANREAAKDY